MSRYLGPRLKKIRSLSALPGLTKKKINLKKSQYRICLEEKQKLRFYFGITHKQLLIYMHIALKSKNSTGLILLKLLEMRLDNLIFKLGMSSTIPEARQLINHRHILVNGYIVDIPSYRCNLKDIIMKNNKNIFHILLNNNIYSINSKRFINNLKFDISENKVFVNQIIYNKNLYFSLNELLVVEYYSRHT
uniref:Small ribosomal subunit protein uS4c n=1 Tax=Epipogium aphyllum TaxID=449980 RepID=A0A0B4N5B5_9ASPA|nr:ribosomal protein S4 [Epipogium aphyllum]AII40867.1 ribosomal protein S4 [Epipogium aphyllum]